MFVKRVWLQLAGVVVVQWNSHGVLMYVGDQFTSLMVLFINNVEFAELNLEEAH